MSDEGLEELDEGQRALALRLRSLLRESEDVPDREASARLAQGRARAIASTGSSGRRRLWSYGGVTAMLLLAALLVMSPPLQQVAPDTNEATASDALDVLTDELDTDFYEDLDMYRWLAQDSRV